jgi:hypothetical protein
MGVAQSNPPDQLEQGLCANLCIQLLEISLMLIQGFGPFGARPSDPAQRLDLVRR